MLKIFLIVLFANLIIGIIVTFISRDKYPFQRKKNVKIENFESKQDEQSILEKKPDKIETEIESVEDQQETIKHSTHERDEDLITQLAEKLIPTENQVKDPQEEAAKEMGDHIKDYVDSHPEQASKVFKHWMNTKSND